MEKQLKHISKLMSLVLRHRPETIGLQLDENGWAIVDELIEKINAKGIKADRETIETIVAVNDKKRFTFNDDQTKIRASQGHSLQVELNLEEKIPPVVLYHGTTAAYLESILESGIQKQSRQHVHLSETVETAKAVGSRHGKPVILTINAKEMQEAGYTFYQSANQVWLTDEVPPRFINVQESEIYK
jgi:putative RNA 2'-phosphotransferase